ncbi:MULTISPECIES: PKD domain-containing protein [Spongiibacter]|uniref:PKD domain-containing protein n=1 Tax=Spongiibacter TaxID=630749 RepID=UPI002352C023|nr:MULTISPECIES: PKD domain-containing protein [Spongiibacter]
MSLSSKLAVAALAVSLAACGGSSSSSRSSGSGGGGSATDPLAGRIIDSPVQGLRYVTSPGSRAGITNVNGVFDYLPSDAVSFSIGSLMLGNVPGAPLVTLLDLVDGARAAADSGATLDEVFASYPQVLNIARLLQSLDVDGDSSNGIQVPFEANAIAANYASQLDFSDPQMFASDDKPAVQFVCDVKQSRGANICSADDIQTAAAAEAEVRDTEAQRNSGTPINLLPTVQVGADISAQEGATVTLAGIASDEDGSVVSLLWQQSNRNGVPVDSGIELTGADGNQASFVAPEVDEDRIFYFTLTATDNSDESAYDIIAVSVSDSSGGSNIPPTADAGEDQTVTSGDDVTLDGSASADSDGAIASYLWEQSISGDEPSVTLTNADIAQASFTAPTVEVATQLTFRLTVTDAQGASSSDEQIVTVQPGDTPANQAPTADAGDAQNVSSGDQVALLGSGSDPDEDVVTFAWEQLEGSAVTLENADQAEASFVAPDVSEQEVLTFKLTVSDGELNASAQVAITVTPLPTCDATDPTTYAQCFVACTDGDVATACPLPYEEFIPDDFSGFEQIAEEFENCADMDPETLCLLPIEEFPEFPGEPSELLGQLCEDASDLQQCFTSGVDRLCSAFDPSSATPFCADGGEPSDPEFPIDPALLFGELCDDISDPAQCFSDGVAAFCEAFDSSSQTPLCGGGSDPTFPEFPLDPGLLLGELCEDVSDVQQCFADGAAGLCETFDPDAETPFCGEPSEPGEPSLPFDPADLFGQLCDDSSDVQQCFADGVAGLCETFDPDAETPFCGEPSEPGEPSLPFDPADLLGQLCDDTSDLQQCFTDGVAGICDTFDSSGQTPFCGEPSEPALPFDPADLFGQLCEDSGDLQQCFADGVAGFCATFDPSGATPFCGEPSDPSFPPEFPFDPSELLGALCEDASNPQQCFTDGLNGICEVFDSSGQTPFCGEPTDPPELPFDPEELLGEFCSDVSNPQQCFADGLNAFCGAFDSSGQTPFCGEPSDPSIPELPLDPAALLGEFCEDSSDLQQCFAEGVEAVCAAFDSSGQTPFCGEMTEPTFPPELRFDPAVLLGQLCEDVSNPQQCFTDGVAGLCETFDAEGATPFCGEGDPAEPPAFPLDPAVLLGQLCEDVSDPQQCFSSGLDGLCSTFDPNGLTPFCGEPSDPSIPELPIDPADLLGQFCEDSSDPQQCLTEGVAGLCGAFDPDGLTPFCGGATDPGLPPELPLDPGSFLGQLCEDQTDLQQCFADGFSAVCETFDPESATPFCAGTGTPELPFDPSELLGQLCEDSSDPAQCLSSGAEGLCAVFDAEGQTPLCGGAAEPGELPVDPSELLGQLCDDVANLTQCFADGASGICETFDPDGATPFCGGATDPELPEFPFDPSTLVGQLCEDVSSPEQCFTDGVNSVCETFDAEGQTPFCSGDGIPLDPAALLGQFCEDVSQPEQCFTDGAASLCNAFDPEGATPFCGEPSDPTEFPLDPSVLLGQLCEDASDPQQCLTDGVAGLCGSFDPDGLSPFCGESSDPALPSELPLDPDLLLGELCGDASSPDQCLSDGVASICETFDPDGATLFCGA